MLLVRRINRDEWAERPEGFASTEVPATLLKRAFPDVDENRLSLWTADTEDAVTDIALALITASKAKPLSMFDLTWFHASDLALYSDVTEASDGDTAVADLVGRHCDAVRLDAHRLAVIAELVAGAVNAKRVHRFLKDDLGDLLLDAVDKRRLREPNLRSDLKTEIARARERREAH